MPSGITPLDLLRAAAADPGSRAKLSSVHRDLLRADEAKRETIRSHHFLSACFEFDPLCGRLRWQVFRPRLHFNENSSWKRWETRCAGQVVENARTISVTYRGRNDTLSPSKIAAVLLSGRGYDEIRSVRFRDGAMTNLSRSNLLISIRESSNQSF